MGECVCLNQRPFGLFLTTHTVLEGTFRLLAAYPIAGPISDPKTALDSTGHDISEYFKKFHLNVTDVLVQVKSYTFAIYNQRFAGQKAVPN